MPGIVKVSGFDLDIHEESVVVEEHCASSLLGHVKLVREKLVVNILNRFLQCGDMPLACDLLLDGSYPFASGSWKMLSLFCAVELLGKLLSK